ncbi:protein of unknown function (plasmid) [Caballeronia sp. S22]
MRGRRASSPNSEPVIRLTVNYCGFGSLNSALPVATSIVRKQQTGWLPKQKQKRSVDSISRLCTMLDRKRPENAHGNVQRRAGSPPLPLPLPIYRR